ncbi:signal transduction histidine kinase [Sphingopyxis sp. BE259]|jgi:signal transduction histidine kinase|nr:signal transduction histidine kinase [Sphingopyxis sp. BE122]MDR7227219.1 signal transduction histidine kinase [Sphingopyxis sp. BE259]
MAEMDPAPATAAAPDAADKPAALTGRMTGSLARRMIAIAALWISVLLVGGGFALDRVLTGAITRNFDSSLEYVLIAMIRSSEIGPDGEVRLVEPLGDQRFLEPYSGLYWQISGGGQEPYRSRSLWERSLKAPTPHIDDQIHTYDSNQFPDEELRVLERNVILPGSKVSWRYQIAQSRVALDAQVGAVRATLIPSLALLGLGLIILAALQTFYGLWPLRHIRRAIAAMRGGQNRRVDAPLPLEVQPMVDELNALLAHNEKQAEEARLHAGNLAHALKTPLTVLLNSATSQTSPLADTVRREAATMQRQVEHHLARARAVGRRGAAQARANVRDSVDSVTRAVALLYPQARLDAAGDKQLIARVERQDLDELVGNLLENAAKYGGGSVFVTIQRDGAMAEILVEDDGAGISPADRTRIFDRGVRLDSGKPGTGLGLAIVRDVAEIYGGSIALEESEDLGGLLVRLRLPAG